MPDIMISDSGDIIIQGTCRIGVTGGGASPTSQVASGGLEPTIFENPHLGAGTPTLEFGFDHGNPCGNLIKRTEVTCWTK